MLSRCTSKDRGSVSVQPKEAEVDVCLVVEGCYPYISGGVSSWLDWLIKQQPQRRFGVITVVANDKPLVPRYELPSNVVLFRKVVLSPRLQKPTRLHDPKLPVTVVRDLICRVLAQGDPDALADLSAIVNGKVEGGGGRGASALATEASFDQLMSSRFGWEVMVGCYHRLTPHASFPDFFWAWRALVGGLFAVLASPLPAARVYHSISTGYAGLIAAHAAVSKGYPAAITEHGIYTNERRIDLLMAEWIVDTIGLSLSKRDERVDIRGFWIATFEAYATLCYRSCRRITTLYGENQAFQKALGAPVDRLEVIPNGIHFEKYASIEPVGPRSPTVALIGRVVPIKDIKTFILAVSRLRASVPDVSALLLGPTDEDPEYYAQCQQLVEQLDLCHTFRFTGKVDIVQLMPQIDVLVLTSISEAQPLVILEAGAAGIPCVATDVGSCREIVEGLPHEEPKLGAGGTIVPLMSPEATAEALAEMLTNEKLRRSCGETLRRRVQTYFTSEASAARYSKLYDELMAP